MPKRSLDDFMAVQEGSDSRKPNNSLFVSFSKRRTGLFSKAADICDLFDGAQVAVLVLSPTGNPFAFGHSSVDNVLHRYFLRQPTIPSTTYPLMITTTTATTMSDKHRHQAQQVETLKARVKRAQNRDGSTSLRDLKAWIDKASESCQTAEELEFLKEKFLALLESVKSRLILRNSSPSSLSNGEEKLVETDSTVVGPAEDYVLDFTDHTAMAAHVLCDHVGLLSSQNDMSYLSDTLDQSPQEGKVVIDETGYVFDDQNCDSFYPINLGGEVSSAANIFSDVPPLAVMGPPNDLLYNDQMEMISDVDQVFDYLDQVPGFYLEACETEVEFELKEKDFKLFENNLGF
ncbi:hypothetical protein TIFTF001_007036 [Ficus carica]|uniref:MADS-box domain-containing protein n=1 Tax=Ficus carica TaxID=3494 RepID=A0AA87ZSF2_FICCA|nr:hypothetical protein TIFTF001_007036 [Ficus carica]